MSEASVTAEVLTRALAGGFEQSAIGDARFARMRDKHGQGRHRPPCDVPHQVPKFPPLKVFLQLGHVAKPLASDGPRSGHRHPGLHPRQPNDNHSQRHRHGVVSVDAVGDVVVVNI